VGSEWWRYENLEPRNTAEATWAPATRGDRPWDQIDFHLDLGCGTVPKGRLGIDRHPHPNVDLVMDLDYLYPDFSHGQTAAHWHEEGLEGPESRNPGLPFPDNSIESIVSHHALEHIGDGFIRLMDECHRVLVPGGPMRIIVPLFPSYSAVADPDHKRYFMVGTFETFCGTPDGAHWHESFSVPYTSARFEMVEEDYSPPTPLDKMWTPEDAREIRVTLRKWS
jgi:SAM-dependent methyltransferase